jgi:23S rRNA (cytosine1962-C5)-methyltransferase
MDNALNAILEPAIQARHSLFDPSHDSAIRLFNGFMEGYPDLVLDVYASTLIIHNYADEPDQNLFQIESAVQVVRETLPWLRAGILKQRNGTTEAERRGTSLFGDSVDEKIVEHEVWYALDVRTNRDAGFFLDTKNVRKWLTENVGGKSILNTFAYTGSFGVAALAGGASRVIQVDRNRKFLDLAKKSYALNGFPINAKDFVAQDFFPTVSRLKLSPELFDGVILDPPFLSTTSKGTVDQVRESGRLINKVRPLISDGGWLIAINNALFASGKEYIKTLEELCKDGYLSIRELIPVPEDCIGYNRVGKPITDPAPFNHSTKIAILDVKRKWLKTGENHE